MKLLVIGINIRHIACSASRAGHEVHAVDGYCDLDLESCALDMAFLSRDGLTGSDGQDRIEALISEHIERVDPQAVVLGPGLEEARVKGIPVLNNPAQKSARISDKLWQARWLEKNGFPFIRTVTSGEELDFPVMIKPRRGAGGVGCRIAQSQSDLDWQEGLIAQEIVSGRAASVSVIGDGKDARALAANEQLIGESWTGAKGFRYCGNITPGSSAQERYSQHGREHCRPTGPPGKQWGRFPAHRGGAGGGGGQLPLPGESGHGGVRHWSQPLPGSSAVLPGGASSEARHSLLCREGDSLCATHHGDQGEAAFSLDGRCPPAWVTIKTGRSHPLRPGPRKRSRGSSRPAAG